MVYGRGYSRSVYVYSERKDEHDERGGQTHLAQIDTALHLKVNGPKKI
jgi:hypothetical protein